MPERNSEVLLESQSQSQVKLLETLLLEDGISWRCFLAPASGAGAMTTSAPVGPEGGWRGADAGGGGPGRPDAEGAGRGRCFLRGDLSLRVEAGGSQDGGRRCPARDRLLSRRPAF